MILAGRYLLWCVVCLCMLSCSTRKEEEEINQKYSLLKYSVIFNKPLYGIVSLSQKGMSMKGTEGNFLPPTPEEIGLPKKLDSFPLVSTIQEFSIQFNSEI